LFLKDKKGAFFLLSAIGDSRIDLNAVSKLLGVGRFSFGSPELLMECLGVTPGSVTLYAIINDTAHRVRVLLDEALFAHSIVNFHPLRNDATTAISPQDVLKFLDNAGHKPTRLAFDQNGAPRLIDQANAPAHVEGQQKDPIA
jgi:Ala-tRNA(Pro) deacylase